MTNNEIKSPLLGDLGAELGRSMSRDSFQKSKLASTKKDEDAFV
jgi:hypothetical protein